MYRANASVKIKHRTVNILTQAELEEGSRPPLTICPFETRCLQWVLLQVPESIVVLVTWDYPLFGVVLFSVFVSFALRNFLLRYPPRKLQLYFIKIVFDNILTFLIIAETFHSLRDTYTRLHEPVASFMTYDKPT